MRIFSRVIGIKYLTFNMRGITQVLEYFNASLTDVLDNPKSILVRLE